MKRLVSITAAFALAFGLLAAGAAAQQVVDGIAVVVNGTPILRSEIADAAAFARLSDQLAHPAQSPSDAISSSDAATALQHLEDEQLLLDARASEGFAPPPDLDAQASAQWLHLAAAAGGATALNQRLAALGLDRSDVVAQLRRQLAVLFYLDQHFSTLPAPTDAMVQRYYQQIFVPQAASHHLPAAPLEQVRATIVALLSQQQRATAEQQWLQQLRAMAVIEVNS